MDCYFETQHRRYFRTIHTDPSGPRNFKLKPALVAGFAFLVYSVEKN